eukprot:TRINITY_DN32717_c0_g1_i1.p2 TRINITY_DN32717_c0_g1~~TRINITY_DN32717_c0_g1_i1.p2  ORF type:complete len:229 (-),score=38.54 TRINITY_DN32717_c0_g1_i1:330-1016(-)
MPGQTWSIQEIVASNPYNPDLVPELEKYVMEQVNRRTYSLEANLALLRLYQFEPRKTNVRIVTHILIKALMALPLMDYSLCTFLIPESVQNKEPIATLNTLAHYLETARFREFWDEFAKSSRELQLETIPGFETAIQAYAIYLLSISYKRVPRAVLSESVNVAGPSLDGFIDSHKSQIGWALVEADERDGPQLIEFPRNEDNYPAMRRSGNDNIPLEQVARLFPVLTA